MLLMCLEAFFPRDLNEGCCTTRRAALLRRGGRGSRSWRLGREVEEGRDTKSEDCRGGTAGGWVWAFEWGWVAGWVEGEEGEEGDGRRKGRGREGCRVGSGLRLEEERMGERRIREGGLGVSLSFGGRGKLEKRGNVDSS